ncbi:hypothetical protein [Mammaliicoccus sciuri]|uniref:Uncharacterized protein n=1 Tax=Mammaliicoccus sciuri TaxID=1296 RepID=A0AAW5LK81_MAMSC|nr:hypothetical protein [Mammaliicoccus sciuri]MCQ9303065.1 hypothetical protein [Mammaliicoccus sciuri]
MSFLLNPYVSALLSTLFVSMLFYFIKYLFGIYKNKASIKKAELKIIDLSLRYIYAHNQFSIDTLNNIISGVSVQEKVKIEKLRSKNDYLAWIIVKIIDDFVLDNNQKEENINNINKILKNNSVDEEATLNNQNESKRRKKLLPILFVATSFCYLYLIMIYLLTSPEFNEKTIFSREDDSLVIFGSFTSIFISIMAILLMRIRYIKNNTH